MLFARRRFSPSEGGRDAAPARRRGITGNPYLFLGPRPFREARLRSYIISQHRAGRPLSEITLDPYVRRCGSENFFWHVVQDARTLVPLEDDVRETIKSFVP